MTVAYENQTRQSSPARAQSTFDYAEHDGLGLAELVRAKQVTPRKLVEAAIARIEAINPAINAVIHKMYDQARAAADKPIDVEAPFAGVPFLVKDLQSEIAGEPFRRGSRFYKDAISTHDTELVTRFRKAGLIFLGKTNTPELGLTALTEPELFGPTRTPYDLSRASGGSSGGSGAAVAARMVPIASGGDGMGSLRIPASCCGVFSMKPSRGRTPSGPAIGAIFQGFAIEGVLSRSVRDSAAMLDAISGGDPGAPFVAPLPARPFLEEVTARPRKLRIAYTSKPFIGSYVREDCLRGLEQTVALLKEMGHELIEAGPTVDRGAFSRALLRILAGEFAHNVEAGEVEVGRKATSKDFETTSWLLVLMGRQFKAGDFVWAQSELARAARTAGRFMEDYDVLLTPTLAEPPPLVGSQNLKGFNKILAQVFTGLNAGGLINTDAQAEELSNFSPFTPLFNVSGQPAMSVPLHWTNAGLPIGMQFAAKYGDEATLFNLAGQLEEARPWRDRAPTL